jgi:hypothetical protein
MVYRYIFVTARWNGCAIALKALWGWSYAIGHFPRAYSMSLENDILRR